MRDIDKKKQCRNPCKRYKRSDRPNLHLSLINMGSGISAQLNVWSLSPDFLVGIETVRAGAWERYLLTNLCYYSFKGLYRV
jgi:hypothetical protein